MKIVYTISGTYNAGGMERVLANKANYLARMGYQIVIITTDQQDRAPYFELDARIKRIDLGVNYSDNAGKSLVSKLISYPNKRRDHRRKLNRVLQQVKPDISISMFDHDADFLWRSREGSKKILEIHFSRFKRLQYGRKGVWKLVDCWRNRADARVAKRYDHFVVLTEEDRSYWGEIPNICVIPNAGSFDVEQLAPLENKTVVAVGRFDYQKNFEALIQAWASVHKILPDWKLLIYGKGEREEDYKTLITRSGLLHSIELRAPVQDIRQVYLASSMLVMSSHYEGLPMALLEAQACGVPLVSFACKCGPKDVIRHGSNGLLVQQGDINGLASAMIRIMQDSPLRKQMGMHAAQNASRFSTQTVMKSWINLFERV